MLEASGVFVLYGWETSGTRQHCFRQIKVHCCVEGVWEQGNRAGVVPEGLHLSERLSSLCEIRIALWEAKTWDNYESA